MPALATILLSAASLAYEILLIRFLTIVESSDYAWMVISLALLGYGTGGTILSLNRENLIRRSGSALTASAAAFSTLSLGCIWVTNLIPFNSLEIAWDPLQILYLLTLYVVLSVPFTCTSLFIGLALTSYRNEVPRIYRADLIGAGLGAAVAIFLLQTTRMTTTLCAVSTAGLAASVLMAAHSGRFVAIRNGSFAVLALPFIWLVAPNFVTPRSSQFKPLSQAMTIPGSTIALERSSALGTVTAVRNDVVPARHAPGLSLSFTGEIPNQIALFRDGDRMTAINHLSDWPNDLEWLDYLDSALGYHLLRSDRRLRVLVTNAGRTTEVASAFAHGAVEVDIVEPNPAVAEIVREDFGEYAGGLYSREGVRIHIDTPRGFVSRAGPPFDLIQWSLGTSEGSSDEYHLTIESFTTVLGRLENDGILSVTSGFDSPPRTFPRLLATLSASLRERGLDPATRIILIRGWDSATVIARMEPFDESEVDRARRFCRQRSFDLAWAPGIDPTETNQFNVRRESDLYEASKAILGPIARADDFLQSYKFDIRPATDDRPWFSQYFRWKAVRELVSLHEQGGAALMDWRYLVIIATLAQAIILSFTLNILPLFRLPGQPLSRGAQKGQLVLYFGGIGLGFLMMEIAFIQKVALIVHHPIFAVAIVLSSFLVFAGLGSGTAASIEQELNSRSLPSSRTIALSIGVAALVAASVIEISSPYLSGAPAPVRLASSLALLAPLSFLMGMPMPIGLNRLATNMPDAVPLAWGINGCASVIGAALAPLVGTHLGIRAVIALAIGLYLLSSFALSAPKDARSI